MKRTCLALTVLIPVLLSFVFFLPVNGQVKKKPQSSPKPKTESPPKSETPLTKQKATTEDGKFVLLKSDGTWEYDNEPRSVPPTMPTVPVPALGNLRFKAAVVTKAGTVIPVARGNFTLLDEDLKILLASRAKEKIRTGNEYQKMVPYMLSMDYDLIKSHITAKTTTDFEGNGLFPPVEPKTYFVFFMDFVGQNSILWSFKVDIKSGDNYIVLDQNNALETFSR